MRLCVPTAWEALTDRQLNYVAACMATERFTPAELQLRFLRRFVFEGHGEVWRRLEAADLVRAAEALDWMNEPPRTPVRPARIGNFAALDAHLFDEVLTFGEYLICENLFQGWIATQNAEAVDGMAMLLYRDDEGAPAEGRTWTPGNRFAVLIWWTALKNELAERYDDLFKRVGTEDDDRPMAEKLRESVDAQIRALTGGDVTKERAVLDTDVHRALTELNAKAREARETYRRFAT